MSARASSGRGDANVLIVGDVPADGVAEVFGTHGDDDAGEDIGDNQIEAPRRRDNVLQAAFLDRDVRPGPRDQFGFRDNFTGVFQKRNQDVVSPATKWNDLARLHQGTLGDIELEWAKPKPDCTE